MWAQRVQHPSAGLTKEYVVTCDKEPSRRELEALAAGCEVDGTFVTPVAVAPVKEVGQKQRLRVVIAEGRNREVLSTHSSKRMALLCSLVALAPYACICSASEVMCIRTRLGCKSPMCLLISCRLDLTMLTTMAWC